jgi:hypothetical protein
MLVRHLRRARCVRVASLALTLLVQVVDVPRVLAQSASIAPASSVRVASIRDGELAAAIERAVKGARRRLEQDACAAVFEEFSDQTGRTLADVASALALSPDDSLARVIFRDGRDSVTCRATRPSAFTGVGSRVVFVCPSAFGSLDSESAELVIIHELLHTLGLGERPPSSSHINQVVARRCS